MKKILIALAIVSTISTAHAQTTLPATNPINISDAALANLNFIAGLLNESVSDLASQILSAYTVPFKTVSWDPSFTTNTSVSIIAIKQVNNNPFTYDLVRQISASAPNTGIYNWVPQAGDNGANVFIEIGCVQSSTACQAFSLIANP